MAQAARKLETPQVTQTKTKLDQQPQNITGQLRKMYFKQERNAAIALGVLLVIMSCLVIWSNTAVTKTQATIQDINQKVSTLQTSNANMKEEISELSSRTRLMEIAKDVGLQMNDKNIRNVTK
ncbi:cell division protein FtsL [Ligilactobacillus murinus]|uniref:Cell division protein FtsL n=1 Tax=Ligilactobacillus murinus TaxID=1622 RepID=A0ABN5MG82_9LACO|nr:cell division protein FtsL [Ligilactobacillus murinus]AWZ40691.1 cell division protein FtsL [Ligilactobacillus murinus]MBX9011505.1 cell division protein FtsL [Ligilactobacillus murinus]MCR1889785.1 cell division protein FtsL [Ligilactobacillus murinus]HBV48694.1 cell division protein FtsL [Lactobacillus sp.]